MTSIEDFISKVEAGAVVAIQSGILPDPDKERLVLKRLSEKCPELDIDPEKEQKIIEHVRLSLNARNS